MLERFEVVEGDLVSICVASGWIGKKKSSLYRDGGINGKSDPVRQSPEGLG